ncbi:MAG: hypothetical protein J6Z01_05625 [Bacteroidales bacterium]|nr:hypothetical protein [Bacteroidales bacterium]
MKNYSYKAKCDKNSTNQGEWVDGNLIICDNGDTLIVHAIKFNIRSMQIYRVIRETVCKITDYVDKNDKNISEGDILQSDNYPFLNDIGQRNYYGVVVWINSGFYVETVRTSATSVRGCSEGNFESLSEFVEDNSAVEIIGNVLDNKYLLNPNYKY